MGGGYIVFVFSHQLHVYLRTCRTNYLVRISFDINVLHPNSAVVVICSDQDNGREVSAAVEKLAARFNHFGRALGLNASDITEIQQTFPHNRQDGLAEIINLWLQQNYNFDKYGVPSWRTLVVAVESQSGGKNRALAKKIAAEHPGKFCTV